MMSPQKIVLAVSAVGIPVVTLFPPWLYVYTPPNGSEGGSKAQRSAGHRLINSAPVIDEQVVPLFGFSKYMKRDQLTKEETPTWAEYLSDFSVKLDMDVLVVEIVAILILTGLLYFLLRNWCPWSLNSEAEGR